MRKTAKRSAKEPEPPDGRKILMTDDTWRVYLLRCGDGSLYCGATNDLDRRIAQHNDGKASRYTRVRLPVTLAASSQSMSKGDALSLEAKIKKLNKKEKIPAVKSA